MKKIILPIFTAALALFSGCASDGAKQKSSITSETPSIVWFDPVVKKSVVALGVQVGKTADGRMRVAAQFRNTENRRIEVQANCVFKDAQGFKVDETPFRAVFFDENAPQEVSFEAFNLSAEKYTINVRQAR